jgi:hypothetical protein
MKTCTKCHIERDFSEFSKTKKTKDGLQLHCKRCVKEYYENNKNKILEKSKNRYENSQTKQCDKNHTYNSSHYKICPKCNTISELKKCKNGHEFNRSTCRQCPKCQQDRYKERLINRGDRYKEEIRAFKRNWARENREVLDLWVRNNRDRSNAIKKKWRDANPDKTPLATKAWRKANPGKDGHYVAKRRSKLKHAIPPWLTPQHIEEIKSFYKLAKELQWLSEEPLHVDHIVPLQGKNVCGLHVPWNLQILPRKENMRKGNRITKE